jgi:flagellar biosynthesis protein FlhF
MLKESFIATTPEEAYKLAIKKYGSINNFKIVKASQYKNKENILVSEITIEVDEDAYLNSAGISEEEELINELNLLKEKMNKMKEALNPQAEGEETLAIDEVKDILIDRGLSRNWVEYMLNPFIGTQVAEDKSLLQSFVLEEIEEALKISTKPIEHRINILVGPTGVGKTTTIAKLTGWAALKGLNPDAIALINLDNFRVGAYEQLGYYAKTMGVDYYCPQKPEELGELIDSLHTKELILIDTAGSSPYDLEKLLNTVKYCKSIDESLDTLSATLVVSVTSKYSDLKDIYEHFSFLNIDNLIATKFDETKNVGNLIAFLLDTKLPVSFLSVGQEVPIDFEIATKRRILEAFVGEIEDNE